MSGLLGVPASEIVAFFASTQLFEQEQVDLFDIVPVSSVIQREAAEIIDSKIHRLRYGRIGIGCHKFRASRDIEGGPEIQPLDLFGFWNWVQVFSVRRLYNPRAPCQGHNRADADPGLDSLYSSFF